GIAALDQIEECRLARAVWTNDRMPLAARDVEADAMDDARWPKTFVDIGQTDGGVVAHAASPWALRKSICISKARRSLRPAQLRPEMPAANRTTMPTQVSGENASTGLPKKPSCLPCALPTVM